MKETLDTIREQPISAEDSANKLYWRAALASAVMFFLNGAIFATWVSRIPDIQSRLSLEPSALGLAILAQGVGAMISMRITGKLSSKYGSGQFTFLSLIVQCIGLFLVGCAADRWQLTMALAFFGAAGGVMEVAMNAHALASQRLLAKPIVSRLHALWSFGGMFGALVGAGMAKISVHAQPHFFWVGLLFIATGVVARPLLLQKDAEIGDETDQGDKSGTTKSASGFKRALFLWCLICFLGFTAEGAVADWSGLYMEHSLKSDAAAAAMAFACFSTAMALGRLVGDHMISLLGRKNLLCFGNLLTGLAIVLMLILANAWLAPIAFIVAGFGLCTLAPIVYTCAGNLTDGRGTADVISNVSMAGFAGILVGPPLLGFAAQSFGFAAPFVGVASISFAICLLAFCAETGDSKRSSN